MSNVALTAESHDIAWAIVDGYAYIKNPTMSNLGWVAFDVASLLDSLGYVSVAAHAGKLAKMEKMTSEMARTGKNKYGARKLFPGVGYNPILYPHKSSMIHVEKSKHVFPEGTFEVKYLNITNVSSPMKALKGNGDLVYLPPSGKNRGVSLHPNGKRSKGIDNPKIRLPRTNGKWKGEPGNGKWYSDNKDVLEVTGGKAVEFKNNRPDFSPWSKGQLKFKKGQLNGTDSDFNLVYDKLMKAKGFTSRSQAKNWLRKKD